MGGEATPGLGPPDDELVLGRVSKDRALCIPPDAGLNLLTVLAAEPGRAKCPVW